MQNPQRPRMPRQAAGRNRTPQSRTDVARQDSPRPDEHGSGADALKIGTKTHARRVGLGELRSPLPAENSSGWTHRILFLDCIKRIEPAVLRALHDGVLPAYKTIPESTDTSMAKLAHEPRHGLQNMRQLEALAKRGPLGCVDELRRALFSWSKHWRLTNEWLRDVALGTLRL